MAPEPFLLSYPPEARLAFGHDEALRRMGKVARFNSGCRVLHLGCGGGAASVLFAREFGCSVTAADADEAALEKLRERVKANNLADRVQVRAVDYKKLPFPEAEFECIFADGRIAMTLDAAAKKLRRFLAPKGRLCLVYPVKVGRQPNRALLDFWEKKLAEPLRLPREVLQTVELAGYEPQTIESATDAEMEEFYRSVEAQLGSVTDAAFAQSLREEISMHRSQQGRTTAAFALLIARRKEPGEKPPPSRSDG